MKQINKRKLIGAAALLLIVLLIGLCAVILYPDAPTSDTVGTVRLNVETYLAGKNQPTHPSVMVFDEPWNGYRYWMAYSPYPLSNGEEENACIAVSNDLYDWSVPYGLANPVADNEETNCNELKDPHLLYRADLDRLEVWYLGRVAEHLGGNNHDLILFRKYSSDGVNWSDYEIMDVVKYLSPSVTWDGEKYQMWSIGYDMWDTTGQFVYQESSDGFEWTEPVQCSIDGACGDIDIWHGSMYAYEDGFHFVYIAASEKQKIYYCTSSDGITFSDKQVIVENGGWWSNFYRPTLVMEQGSVACIYGVINDVNEWYLSMSTGPELSELKGISSNDMDRMHQMADDVTDTKSAVYRLGVLKDSVKSYLSWKFIALMMAEMLCVAVLYHLRSSRRLLWCAAAANILLSIAYIFIRRGFNGSISFFGAILAFLLVNAVFMFILSYLALWTDRKKHKESR